MKIIQDLLSHPRLKGAIRSLRQQANQVGIDVRELIRDRPKLSAGLAAVILLSLWWAYVSGSGGMPLVDRKSRSALPTSVNQAVLKVFDSRFVELGGSYFTIAVHYTPNVMKELGKIPFLGGSPEAKAPQAPVVAYAELIELKGLRTEVTVETLKASDHLNKVKWKGTLSVRGQVERRRSLRLTDWLRTVVENDPKTPVPWFDQHVTLENLDDQQANQIKPLGDRFGEMMKLFTGDLTAELTQYLEGGEWGDWVECGNACYQSSHATLRDDAVTVVTTESPDAAFVAGPEITLLALYASNLFQIQALAQSDSSQVFLIKPNLSALRQAKLLK
jgi:hypothetical protein